MPTARCDGDRRMRSSILILIALLAFLFTPVPQAMSATPARLAVVSGTLSPGETKAFSFSVPRDLEDFLLHVTVTTTAPDTDRLDITIEQAVWTNLQGDWWDTWGGYGLDPLAAGDHTLNATASGDAVNPVAFTVEFYDIPTTPFTVQGTFPAEPYNKIAYIHISLPEAGNYSISADAAAGNFALTPQPPAPNQPIDITGATKRTLQIGEAGVYEFQVQADVLGKNEATAWSFTIGSPTSNPSLHVEIGDGCTNTAPGSSCVFRANATASDGSHPSILYNWTASGGCFVNAAGGCVPSILSQNVNWKAPGGSNATYRVTVNATANGYENGVATWPIVVPEFSSTGLALVITVASAAALILVGRRRKR